MFLLRFAFLLQKEREIAVWCNLPVLLLQIELFSAFVNDLIAGVLLGGKLENGIADVTVLEVGDIDVSPKQRHFDAQVDGYSRLFVDECLHDFHSFASGFQLQRKQITAFSILNRVGVVVRRKLEVARIFVLLVGCGVENADSFLPIVQQCMCNTIVPSNVAAFHEFALFPLIAD